MAQLPDTVSPFDVYQRMYKDSITDPEGFWFERGKRLSWIKPYTVAKNTSFSANNVHIKWFEDGELNVCYNCVDRHLAEKGDQIAIIYEADDPKAHGFLTYNQLHQAVSQCANGLKQLGVKKGDRVLIYLPMIPKAAVAMLACARIGAIHCVVFGGFSAESLASRIIDCTPKVIITTDMSYRGGKAIGFKQNVDKALTFSDTDSVEKVLVIASESFTVHSDRDINYQTLIENQSSDCIFR